MTLRIEWPQGLAADQRLVFRRLLRTLSGRDADRVYDALPESLGGSVISVDVARFVADEFATWDGRVRHTLSTAKAAGGYAHDRIVRELRSPGKRKRLVITAGGAGSGKTSLLGLPREDRTADLILDNQLQNFDRARKILTAAHDAGWEVWVLYVHRPFHDVVRAVIERSQRTGRWNRLADLPAAHAQCQATILRLLKQFRRNNQIRFRASYNASKGVPGPDRGSSVYFRDLRKGGRYHLGDAQQLLRSIPPILDAAVQGGIVCRELAGIIGEGLPQARRRA